MWTIATLLVLVGLLCVVSILLRHYRKTVTAFEPETPRKGGRYERTITRFHAAQRASQAKFERRRQSRKARLDSDDAVNGR